MISFASRCQEEKGVVTLDVEIVEKEVRVFLMPRQVQSEKMYMSLDELTAVVGETVEGDILVVEHDGVEVLKVLGKDELEKQRRIECLNSMM